jgi:hypothetical protein
MACASRNMRPILPPTQLQEDQIARQIVSALVGTAKNIILYSESHVVYHSALKKLKNIFVVYFSEFGNFRIHIQGNKIIHENVIMYEGHSEPLDLAFLLHRDGILWIEFQIDVELFEIDSFFRALHNHSALTEEPEDDIVTALWELDLPSIVYAAADLELDYQDNLNFDAESDDKAQNKEMEEKEANANNRNESIYLNVAAYNLSEAYNEDLWQLSAEERRQLQEMIASEEKLDGSDYVMDALLYILEKHPFEEDIKALLEMLLQELREILTNARFGYLLQTFVKLKQIATSHRRLDWIKPHFDHLFARLSSKLLLNGLLDISVDVHHFEDTQIEDLKRFLLMLDSSAIPDMVPIARHIRSVELQRAIIDAVRFMAASDFRPLEKLISESDADLIQRIVPIMSCLNDQRSRQTLTKLLHHPSELVRLQALKTILDRDHQAIHDIFALIDDPDEKIRTFVLKRLGRRRCRVVEDKILEYLNTYRPGGKNSDHFFALCCTLGRCGSERSLPFLSQLLFKWPTLGILRSARSPHRKGAVAALKALRTKKAAILMKSHQRGFFGSVLMSATHHFFGLGAGERKNVH